MWQPQPPVIAKTYDPRMGSPFIAASSAIGSAASGAAASVGVGSGAASSVGVGSGAAAVGMGVSVAAGAAWGAAGAAGAPQAAMNVASARAMINPKTICDFPGLLDMRLNLLIL